MNTILCWQVLQSLLIMVKCCTGTPTNNKLSIDYCFNLNNYTVFLFHTIESWSLFAIFRKTVSEYCVFLTSKTKKQTQVSSFFLRSQLYSLWINSDSCRTSSRLHFSIYKLFNKTLMEATIDVLTQWGDSSLSCNCWGFGDSKVSVNCKK